MHASDLDVKKRYLRKNTLLKAKRWEMTEKIERGIFILAITR